ncbi:MAG TPA: type II CAAX endopeptidase family protein [Myxococcota bacterium]|nr:type II CAAX endopeptidase family protein [Myxococcota bacterium]
MLSAEPKRVWIEVVAIWAIAIGVILAFKLLDFVPLIKENLWGIAGLVFLFLPLEWLYRRGENPADFGISRRGLWKGLLLAAILVALTFPAYIPAYKWWFSRTQGFHLHLPSDFWKECVGFIFLVALPEEAFYRGYLQTRLDKIFRKKVKILGAEVGWSVVVAAAFFALGHLVDPRLDKLGTFFPGLLFGWMRARTGSICGAVAFHALCDIWAEVLRYGYF